MPEIPISRETEACGFAEFQTSVNYRMRFLSQKQNQAKYTRILLILNMVHLKLIYLAIK